MEDDDLESGPMLIGDLPARSAFKGGVGGAAYPARAAGSASGSGSFGATRGLYELEETTLHGALSAHLSGDWSHPKRLSFLVQYASGLILLVYALCAPFFPRQHHVHGSDGAPHDAAGDSGFGRNWFTLMLMFQAVHQLALGYASAQSLQLASHDIEYYEHNLWGVIAWLMGGLTHVARLCLIWDVSRAHGSSIGGGTIFLLLTGSSVLIVYFFYAYRSSLSARVAAVSHALMSLALSFALFHASNLSHVAPGAAIGAAVGLWLYALLVYPLMSAMRNLQRYVWMMEVVNLLCWTWILFCYQAFDNCVAT